MKNQNHIRARSKKNPWHAYSKIGLKGGKTCDVKWLDQIREMSQGDFDTYTTDDLFDLDVFSKVRKTLIG